MSSAGLVLRAARLVARDATGYSLGEEGRSAAGVATAGQLGRPMGGGFGIIYGKELYIRNSHSYTSATAHSLCYSQFVWNFDFAGLTYERVR